MKKLMKAIAFATVMCMLLSTAAFAADPVPTLDSDYQFDVVVATTAEEQVALLVVKNGANLASLANTDILYVGQEASDGTSATFANVVVDSEDVTDDKVDIYAGYASANGPAVSYTGFSVKSAPTLSISLAEVKVVQDVENWNELTDAAKAIKVPENDIATLVLAKVTLTGFTSDNEVSKIGWEFDTNDGKRYVEVDAADYGLEFVEGDIQIGVSFTNGAKDNTRPHLTISDTNLYFKVDNASMQATK